MQLFGSEQSFVRYSDCGIELKAEQEFYEVHGEAPGGEDGIELNAVVEEPANLPKIRTSLEVRGSKPS